MSFAEFMRQALYDPAQGYYSRSLQQIGKRGDFFTNVSVGPFFGELLAFQFMQWRETSPSGAGPFHIVEAGAHNGQLAFDILKAFEKADPKLLSSIQYWIVEPLAAGHTAQREMLTPFSNVSWFETLAEIQQRIQGVIFSNELLDAMPVHIFQWSTEARCWNEMGVDLSGDPFGWVRLESPTVEAPTLPEELLDVLPDHFSLEISPAAQHWWTTAATLLARGKLMTIDYGTTFEEQLLRGRSGTVRAYSRHRAGTDILANAGEQDITAHVNFSDLQRAGEAVGLKTETFTTQSQFLTSIARDLWTRTGSWPQSQVRQFQTLTHPEHLGRPFRVLIQSR